jgi:diaminohydroxyphosphoribosylaminopyrimidine deaminase/5-amino-6-(5-phosphoribosylamino)uracil reductase
MVYQSVEWTDLLKELGAKGITRLLVEGGGDTLGQLLDLNLIDEVWCFIAPILTGGDKPSIGGVGAESIGAARSLDPIRFKRVGDDILIVATRKSHEIAP